jgi:hypothetical protein
MWPFELLFVALLKPLKYTHFIEKSTKSIENDCKKKLATPLFTILLYIIWVLNPQKLKYEPSLQNYKCKYDISDLKLK